MPSCVNCRTYVPREDARPYGVLSLCERCYLNEEPENLFRVYARALNSGFRGFSSDSIGPDIDILGKPRVAH